LKTLERLQEQVDENIQKVFRNIQGSLSEISLCQLRDEIKNISEKHLVCVESLTQKVSNEQERQTLLEKLKEIHVLCQSVEGTTSEEYMDQISAEMKLTRLKVI